LIKHLLVPLDGSSLAEASIPVASYLAGLLRAEVSLVHIIERNPPGTVHGDTHLSGPEEAGAYLAGIAGSAFPGARRVAWHVHREKVRNVPAGIALHEAETGHDLIVMCTHGRGGAGKFLFGSVAQKVLAEGTLPVLLVKPPARPFTLRTILVPLDGDPEHEGGLDAACELARASGAEIRLLGVVPTMSSLTGKGSETGTLLPGATRVVLEMSVEGARGYLAEKTAAVRAAGFSSTAEVVRGDPAQRIVTAAKSVDADLIALATHRKKGMDAVFSGSVASKVCEKCDTPLLLQPAAKQSTSKPLSS
jgi:nucleotide-binding universal stress UspA family protein